MQNKSKQASRMKYLAVIRTATVIKNGGDDRGKGGRGQEEESIEERGRKGAMGKGSGTRKEEGGRWPNEEDRSNGAEVG
jgi:hypothetical protein